MAALRNFEAPVPREPHWRTTWRVMGEMETLRDEQERETDRIRQEGEDFDGSRRYMTSEGGDA